MSSAGMENLIASSRRRRAAPNAGAAAVELAFTAPLLVALALGIADYGALMNSAASLVSATRAGAEVVMANRNATASDLTALFPSGATPAISGPICACSDNTSTACPPTGSVTCPTPGSATNPCALSTGPDTRVHNYLQVSATQTVSPILSITNLLYFGSFGSQALSTAICIPSQG
jgi:Flp pilus assembly protein TadG